MRKRKRLYGWRASAAAAVIAIACSIAAYASEGLSQVLARILRSGNVPVALRVHSECQTPYGYRRATLYGSGIAIWNTDRQVPISRGALTKVLESVRRRGFAAMPASFGGRSDPAGASRAIRVTCLVEVDAGGTRKEVVQLEGGRQSAELKALADDVFSAVDLSRAGIQATGLDDAVEKLAAGALAPETLDVSMQRHRDPRGAGSGWILRIAGRRLEVERDPGRPEAVERRRVSDREYARLLDALVAARPHAWPPNLWDAGYIDLQVRVLNHARSVQARTFAGMTPETHGSAQRGFTALVGVLSALVEQPATSWRP